MRIAAPILACILCNTVIAAVDELPEIELSDYQWQSLPSGVRDVIAGPDGRIWYHDARQPALLQIADIEESLSKQFNKPSPAVRGVSPVLFETEGRVWFYAPQLRTLLGFDGKEWITKTLAVGDELSGRCQTRDGLSDADTHCVVAGKPWFKTARGVLSFDGKDWHHQDIIEGNNARREGLLLAVHAHGKTALAHHRNSGDVWSFVDGQWKKHKAVFDKDLHPVMHLAMAARRESFFVDKHRRLSRLQIAEDGSATIDTSHKFGDFEINRVHGMYADASGTIYVAAAEIKEGDDNRFEGVAILSPDGSSKAIAAAQASAWNARTYQFRPPILVNNAKQAWLPNAHGMGPALLFDLTTHETVVKLPDEKYRCLLAVDADGRLFVSDGGQGLQTPLMVYAPSGRKLATLTASTIEVKASVSAISSDGTIWAVEKSGHVVCWENGDWQRLHDATFDGQLHLIAGSDGILLLVIGNTAMLYEGSKLLAKGDFFELIETQRERIARHFGRGMPPLAGSGPESMPAYQIAADSQGRIWCLAHHALRVLHVDRWHDATDALVSAGSRRGTLDALALVGAGKQVYLSDLALRHDGGKSFFGEFKDDRLTFSEAPHALRMHGKYLALRSSDEDVWICATEGRAAGTSDLISGQVALRVTDDGIAERHLNEGEPALVDSQGGLWLSNIRGKSSETINRLQTGKIVQQVQIPSYAGGALGNFGKQTLFARTAIGLQKLIAAEDGDDYQLAEQYAIEGTQGRSISERFSSNGYLAILAFTDAPQRRYWLHLVKLP